jgi:hypothetical protein
MLENIKEQFRLGKSFTQSKYYGNVKRELWPKYYWDLYPLAQEYYHELNPYFLFNMYRPEFFRFTKTITVRDGFVPFASFILNNISTFSKLETGTLLIHPDLAPIVPSNISSQFGTWNIVQKKQIELSKARKVYIFGFVSDQYLGTIDQIKEKIKLLGEVSKDAEIELYLPVRKNVFDTISKDSVLIHLVMEILREELPGRRFKILTSEHFFDISNFKDSYFFDLAQDRFIVSDNYLHYYVQSRGATVHNQSLTKAPANSMFSLDLSFHHELHICPLPKEKNIFTDLLFYKKENPSVKDYVFDPVLQSMLREMLKK